MVRKKKKATLLSEVLVKSLIDQVGFLRNELQSKNLMFQMIALSYFRRQLTTRAGKDPTPSTNPTHSARKNLQKDDIIKFQVLILKM